MIEKVMLLVIVTLLVAVGASLISLQRTARGRNVRRRIRRVCGDVAGREPPFVDRKAPREPARADAIRRWYEQSGSY